MSKTKTSQTGRCNDGCDRKVSNIAKIQRCKIWRSAQSFDGRSNTPCNGRQSPLNIQAKFLKTGKMVKYFEKATAICLIVEMLFAAFEREGLYQGSDIVNIQDLVQFVCPFLKSWHFCGSLARPINIQVYG